MLDVLLSADIKPGEKKRVLQEEFDVSMTQEMDALKVSSGVRSIYHDMIADRQRLQMV